MATLPKLQIDGTDWVSINSLTSTPVGKEMSITNVSLSRAIIQESSSKPNISDFYGKPLTNMKTNYAELYISSGSDEIWIRASEIDASVWICCNT